MSNNLWCQIQLSSDNYSLGALDYTLAIVYAL